jgi:protein TonB
MHSEAFPPGRVDGALFDSLVVSKPLRPRKLGPGLNASAFLHVAAIGLLALATVFRRVPPAKHPNRVVPLVYNPGAPIGPAPLRGRPSLGRAPHPRAVTLEGPPPLILPQLAREQEPLGLEVTPSEPTYVEAGTDAGAASGNSKGVSEGRGDGDGGDCEGCNGEGPVLDFDRGPRLISSPKPEYPHEAFVHRIQGTVEVQILIDATGRVSDTRILQSIPVLDAAALIAVRKWNFEPAVKHGRPVATWADAPVRFQID